MNHLELIALKRDQKTPYSLIAISNFLKTFEMKHQDGKKFYQISFCFNTEKLIQRMHDNFRLMNVTILFMITHIIINDLSPMYQVMEMRIFTTSNTYSTRKSENIESSCKLI